MSPHAMDPSPYRQRDRVRVRRALVAVSDKRGLVELATALVGAGVEIVSTRHRCGDRGGRPAGHTGARGHRVPRAPRRARAHAASRRALGPARRPAPRRPRAPARRARHQTLRARRRQPLPVRRDVAAGAGARTPSSSRSTSAASPWCARRRRTNANVAVVDLADRYEEIIAAELDAARAASYSARRWLARHSGTRRRTTRGRRVVHRQRHRPRPARRRGRRSPRGSVARATKDAGPALRREPAPEGGDLRVDGRPPRHRPGRRSSTARSCRTTTSSTPTRRSGPRSTSTSRPSRSSSTRTRAASRSRRTGRPAHRRRAPARPRMRPGLGVRRRDRRQPHRDPRDGRDHLGDLPRGARRARVRGRRGRAAHAEEEHPSAHAARRVLPGCGRTAAGVGRRVAAAGRPALLAGVRVDPRSRRPRRRRNPRRPRVRVDRVPGREVERDRPRVGRRLGRRGHGAGQPRRLVQARGRAGRRSRCGLRCGIRRLLPVPRRPRRSSSTAGCAPSCSRAARCATTRSSRRPARRVSRCSSPASGTSSTESHLLRVGSVQQTRWSRRGMRAAVPLK